MADTNKYLKATWKGEGQPESGITEYGAGTQNPTIPQGVSRQINNPDSNWTFEYVNADAATATPAHNLFSLPVWMYTTPDGQLYHAESEIHVPKDAQNVKKVTYADAMLAGKLSKKVGGGAILTKSDEMLRDKKLKKIADTAMKLRDTPVEVQALKKAMGSAFDLKKSVDGPYSAFQLYMYAVKTGNSELATKLEGWADKTDALYLYAGDLFNNDPTMIRQMMHTPPSELIEPILAAGSWQEINSVVAGMYARVAEKMTPMTQNIPIQPTVNENSPRPIPEAIRPDPPITIEPTTIPTILPQSEEYEEFEEIQGELFESTFEAFSDEEFSTAFSKKYETEDLEKGLHYLRNVPEFLLNEALMQLTKQELLNLRVVMPNFIHEKRTQNSDGTSSVAFSIAPPPVRSFTFNQDNYNKAILTSSFMSIMKMERFLDEAKPELYISASRGDYSPIFTMNFPYMAQLGPNAEEVFGAMQASFRYSLKQRMRQADEASMAKGKPPAYDEILENLDENPYWYINLDDFEKNDPIISLALSDIWKNKTRVDEEGNTVLSPIGRVLQLVQNETGLTEEKIVDNLVGVVNGNLANIESARDKDSVSRGSISGKDGVRYETRSAGRPIGIIINSHNSTLKGKPDTKAQENGCMWAVQDQFAPTLSKLIGKTLDVGVGDTITYLTSKGEKVQISLGLMQAFHRFLPYHIDGDTGHLIATVLGETYDIDTLEGEEKGKVIDALMQDISDKCNIKKEASIEGQAALKNVLQKYQEGVFHEERTKSSAEAAFGSKKEISELSAVDNIHHDTEVLQKATKVVSSLINFCVTPIEELVKNADVDGTKSQKIESILLQRQQEAMLDFEEIATEMGVPMEYHYEFGQILDSTFDLARAHMRKTVTAKGQPSTIFGNVAENFQLLIPIVSAMNYHSKRNEKMEFEKGETGGYQHADFPITEFCDEEIGPTKHAFFGYRHTIGGFKYTVNGVPSYILKEDKPSGAFDITHLQDPKGEAITHQFEGKNNRGTEKQVAHITSVAPFMRTLLQTTKKAKSIRIGKTHTLQTSWGFSEQAESALGLLRKPDGSARCTYPVYGLPKAEGNNIHLAKFLSAFSASEGPGLPGVSVK